MHDPTRFSYSDIINLGGALWMLHLMIGVSEGRINDLCTVQLDI